MLTERLALRRFTTADAANLLSLDGDPQVMRSLTGTTRSLAQIREEVLPDLAGCHLRFPGRSPSMATRTATSSTTCSASSG